MSIQFFTLSTTDSAEWEEILHLCNLYDVYHLPGYHSLAESQESGQAVLFVFQKETDMIAMPLLLRPIEGLPGIESSEYQDATSVYGYPGPIANLQEPNEKVANLFVAALKDYLESQKVITAFSRLNPLIPSQQTCLTSPGSQVQHVGPTAAIDLSLPVHIQRQHYRTNHKRDINKARREGLRCIHDQDWHYFDAFLDVYYQTMNRAKATDYYFFDRRYFACLREFLGNKLHLFVALKDGVVASGALFTVCNAIIQYHLGGTDDRYLDLAPSKLIFDTVRLWGTERGAQVFHLGGGVGSKEDSLFRFKAGFSSLQYHFKVWKMVVNPGVYEHLVEQRRLWNISQGFETVETNYFPAYRFPIS